MPLPFATRMQQVPPSFIREILKASQNPEVISFAGGLPNAELFPVEAIRIATQKVLENGAGNNAGSALQYATTEGDTRLREWICAHYQQQGITVIPSEVLITSGSQQALDLLGKALIDPGDSLLIEAPGYLGAIQALSMYQPEFVPIALESAGLNLAALQTALSQHQPKLAYLVPQFQNPSGVSYSDQRKREIAELISQQETYLIDDNPYGSLRFHGKTGVTFRELMGDRVAMLGSFSKVVVPGFRVGWIVAEPELMQRLVIAKQASDLHTNIFAQKVIAEFLYSDAYAAHLKTICEQYGQRCQWMLNAIAKYLPETVTATAPEGGMFIWLTLPEPLSAMALFELAKADGVVFVPGEPFYVGTPPQQNLRLNFSCANRQEIETGIQRIGVAIERLKNESA